MVRPLLALAASILLVCAGCGEQEAPLPEAGAFAPASPHPTPGCVDEEVAKFSALVGEVDLDGDGSPEDVRKAQGGRCHEMLFVQAADDTVVEVGEADGPPLATAYAVELGDGRRLLVTQDEHPRGGFQVRVYAPYDGGYRELTRDGTDDGEPLLPYAATDTAPGTPLAARCTDDGVRVVEASLTSEIVEDGEVTQPMAWHVTTTTYAVGDDGRARETARRTLPGTVPVDRLADRHPDLTDRAVFADCRLP